MKDAGSTQNVRAKSGCEGPCLGISHGGRNRTVNRDRMVSVMDPHEIVNAATNDCAEVEVWWDRDFSTFAKRPG